MSKLLSRGGKGIQTCELGSQKIFWDLWSHRKGLRVGIQQFIYIDMLKANRVYLELPKQSWVFY